MACTVLLSSHLPWEGRGARILRARAHATTPDHPLLFPPQGLGLGKSPEESSLLFGVAVSLAGAIGTPLGGYLLDAGVRARRAFIAKSDPFFAALLGIRLGGGAGGALAAAVLAPSDYRELDEAESASSSPAGMAAAGADASAGADEAHNPFEVDLKLVVAMPQAAALTVVGGVCIGAGVLAGTSNAPAFFGLLSIGALALCTTTAGVNSGIMASVRAESRSFAIGISTLLVHALGDVPAPPIIGALAESLSPQSCTLVGAALARTRVARVAAAALGAQICTRDAHGLQLTLVAVTSWLIWPAILWFAAWMISEQRSFERRAAAAASAGRALGSPSRFAVFLDALRGLRPLRPLMEMGRVAAASFGSFARPRGHTHSPGGDVEPLARAVDFSGI